MAEEPCRFEIEVTKTVAMSLSATAGRVEFLALVLLAIQPDEVSRDGALMLARAIVDEQSVGIKPLGSSLEQLIQRFDAAGPGTKLKFQVYPSFLAAVGEWIHVPQRVLCGCKLGVLPPQPQTKTPEPPWREIMADRPIDERVTWAEQMALRAQRASENRRRSGAETTDRYEPGRAYGNLLFICHPYPGFPDHQLWLTPDARVYLVDERASLLEAFRSAVVKAGPMVTLSWCIVLASAAAAGGTVLVPALVDAGYSITAWALTSPVESWPVLWAGVEVTLNVAAGVDFPPVTPFDEIAFVAIRTTRTAIRAGRRVLMRVQPGKGRAIKAVVHDVRVVDANTSRESFVRGRWTAVRISKSAEAAKVQGKVGTTTPAAGARAATLTAAAIEALGRKSPTLLRRVQSSGDALLITAANRFAKVGGSERVLSEALSTNERKRDGARYVLRFAISQFSDEYVLKKAMSLEMRKYLTWTSRRTGRLTTKTYRFVDIWTGEFKYEMKSIEELTAYVVAGKKHKFGQLQWDLFASLGSGSTTALDRVKQLRWVFDGDKISMTEEEIAKRLGEYLADSPLFSGYPLLKQLKEALKGIVMVWPKKA